MCYIMQTNSYLVTELVHDIGIRFPESDWEHFYLYRKFILGALIP